MSTAFNGGIPIETPALATFLVTEHMLLAMMLSSPCESTVCLDRMRRGPTINTSMEDAAVFTTYQCMHHFAASCCSARHISIMSSKASEKLTVSKLNIFQLNVVGCCMSRKGTSMVAAS